MRRLPEAALALGAALLVAGGALWLVRPEWGVARAAALGLGGVLALFAVYAGFHRIRAFFGRRAARYGFNVAVMILLVLGIIALVEAVSYRHHWRFDLTENRRHSLSPQTVRLLKALATPVSATAFFRPDQSGRRAAEDLLKQYAARSDGKLAWQVVDPDRNPLLAQRYGVEAYGTVVLEARLTKDQVKEEKVLDVTEEKLTNTLIRVTREGRRVVYFTKGHGERDLASTERDGLSEVKATVEKANYEVKELLLARDLKVPDDAAVLVIPGPQKDLLPQELAAVEAFVARAGKVLVLLDPFQAPGLVPFLAQYGIQLGNDVIIDLSPGGRLMGAGPEVPVVGQYEGHPITQGFRFATLFPLARTVGILEPPPPGVTAQTLARTSSESWAETSRAQLDRGQVKPDPEDQRGPLPIAAVATVEAKAGERAGARARVVVYGDSDFVSNSFLHLSGNRDLFLNTLSWLAEEEDLIAIRPREARATPLFLTAAQTRLVFWLPVVVVPGAVAVSGIWVVVRRRRAR